MEDIQMNHSYGFFRDLHLSDITPPIILGACFWCFIFLLLTLGIGAFFGGF